MSHLPGVGVFQLSKAPETICIQYNAYKDGRKTCVQNVLNPRNHYDCNYFHKIGYHSCGNPMLRGHPTRDTSSNHMIDCEKCD